jgi:ParB-like chromosome segregation protein Spo0J
MSKAPPKPKATPSKPPPSKAKGPPAAGALSKHQKFEVQRLHRSQIKRAAYNPRSIDDWAAKKLRQALEKFGLVEPLIWNKRTGNLVGGHQRLTALDTLDAHDGGTGDFSLDMSVVDVTEKREKALNVVLNNPTLQGDYDLGALRALIGEGAELTPDDVFFDPIHMESLYQGTEWEAEFTVPEPDEVKDAGEELRAMAAARKAEGKEDYAGAPVEGDEDAPFGRLANGEAIRDPDKHAALKEEREHTRAKLEAINDAGDTEYYAIVVLGNREEREAFMVGIGQPKDDKYVNGRAIMSRLGIELPLVTS